MFSSVAMWQTTLPMSVLMRIIDTSLVLLFKFRSHNITTTQKRAAYSHIYCFSSVKAVVHWFQIMRNSAFHMYDHSLPHTSSETSLSHLELFPTQNITAPMFLLYGDQDSLIDMNVMMDQLPGHATLKCLTGYEHLDVLWGKDVHRDVIPEVLSVLEHHSR